jgi:hypothetical protein
MTVITSSSVFCPDSVLVLNNNVLKKVAKLSYGPKIRCGNVSFIRPGLQLQEDASRTPELQHCRQNYGYSIHLYTPLVEYYSKCHSK